MIDVETTGLSPQHHRILELAIIRLDTSGTVIDEWVGRFNPEGPVGATHIHGIRDADVRGAPTFRSMARSLRTGLDGIPIVAHNARFDIAFLAAEFANAGERLAAAPAYCTMDASRHYFPDLDRRRLVDCCSAAGVELRSAHSALGDARATAMLLRGYLRHASVDPTLIDVIEGRAAAYAPKVRQARTDSIRLRRRTPRPPVRRSRLSEELSSMSLSWVQRHGASPASVPYVERLLEAFEDGEFGEAEREEVASLASTYGLGADDLQRAHLALVRGLIARAVRDGVLSSAERSEVASTADQLGVASTTVKEELRTGEAAFRAQRSKGLAALPPGWSHGAPLRVGDRVAFTGCDDRQRSRLERAASKAGVRVTSTVSRLTAMLVTDGTVVGNKHRAAVEHDTRVVHPDHFEVLLRHLQPEATQDAASTSTEAVRTASAAPSTPSSQPASTGAVDPATVRAWARDQGFEVGVRGRLRADIVEAYGRAHGLGTSGLQA